MSKPWQRKTRTPKPGGESKSHDLVRPDKVARARQLIRDPNYPPPAVIAAVAEMLARKLKRADRSRDKPSS
jgi:hypothetical protein